MFVDRRPTFPQPTDSTFVLTYFQRDYIETKKKFQIMIPNKDSKFQIKIPNYDPGFSESSYKQGYPCMPADVFRMLTCGPSNSGKTNILLHMLYELLEFWITFISFQRTCTRTNTRLFCRTLLNKSTPELITRSSRLPVMKSFHSRSYRWTTKKLLFLMIWFVKATEAAS